MTEGLFQGMVRTFHEGTGQKADADLRISLIQEEKDEFVDAVEQEDVISAIDALCDLLYVVYGTADVYKVDLDTVVAEATTIATEINWHWVTQGLPDLNRITRKALDTIKIFEEFNAKGKLKQDLESLANIAWHIGARDLGVNLSPFFKEVHRTNMHKLSGPKREDGKQLKPPGWKPPRIHDMYDRIQAGLPPICEGTCPISDDEIRTGVDHVNGGYSCVGCGGLIVDVTA